MASASLYDTSSSTFVSVLQQQQEEDQPSAAKLAFDIAVVHPARIITLHHIQT